MEYQLVQKPQHLPSFEKCERKEIENNDELSPSLISIKIEGIAKQIVISASKSNSHFTEFLANFEIGKDIPELNEIMEGRI